ncbi:MAG TPA: hypothetical protein VHY91_22330 [Pirellulales bacterium]|jgi:hypothetical protein|nr:hypothetical protein [Pirellulales bacterium]
MIARYEPRSWAGWWLGVPAIVWCTSPLAAQSLPPDVRVARLVGALGSAQSTDREIATLELQDLGRSGRPQLEQALVAADPEVRLRARSLLDECLANDLWSASLVCPPDGQRPASAVLAWIAGQSSNRLLAGDPYGTFQDVPIRVPPEPTTFWHAIDDLCRASGNHLRTQYDARGGGQIICGGPPGEFPAAYSGPLRAQITSARRMFIEEFDYSHPTHSASQVTHTFQLHLHLTWEQRLRLLGYTTQPEVVEARTDTGQLLATLPPVQGNWNAISPESRHIIATLRLTPPATDARRLDVLSLRWPLLAAGEPAALVAGDLAAGRSYAQDDVEVTIESFERLPSGRYEVVLIVSRDRAPPEPAEVVFQENDVDLFDVTGRVLRLQSQTHQFVRRGLEIRLQCGSLSDSAIASSADRPALLRLIYPRLRSRRSLELVFRDVPLPTARPQ